MIIGGANFHRSITLVKMVKLVGSSIYCVEIGKYGSLEMVKTVGPSGDGLIGNINLHGAIKLVKKMVKMNSP